MLELALARPDLAQALVLVGAATPEALVTAREMGAYMDALLDAIAKRNLDAAVEVSVRTWVDGPHRTPEEVDPDVRTRIGTMQRDALVNTRDLATSWSEEPLVDDLAGRLAEITAPTLVIAGELDMDFIHEQARLLADRIPGAHLKQLPNTAHAPSTERPNAFDRVVIPFLARASGC